MAARWPQKYSTFSSSFFKKKVEMSFGALIFFSLFTGPCNFLDLTFRGPPPRNAGLPDPFLGVTHTQHTQRRSIYEKNLLCVTDAHQHLSYKANETEC